MRAIVEICFGPLAGKKAVIEPGGRLRVGRGAGAELVVPHDAQMSEPHVELSWDGGRCRVKDLGSARGTLVDGEPRGDAEIAHGGWIRAGDTMLSVRFEGRTPPRRGADALLTGEKTRALAALQAEPGKLYAALDAARSERVLELLRESVEERRSLYEGPKGDALADRAPYLVLLPPGSALLARLIREGWGKCWGIYLTSERPFKDVRTHLRRFLIVEDDETSARLYFRFYDPGVLRVFLPTCTPRQRAEWFGDTSAFLCEGEGGELLRFTAKDVRPAPAG